MALARARAVAAVKQAQYLGSDRARLAAADEARQDGRIDIATNLYRRLAGSRPQNEASKAAKERLALLQNEARDKLHELDEKLGSGAARYLTEDEVRATFAQYRPLARAYRRVPAVGSEIRRSLARQERNPVHAAILNEPEAAELWDKGRDLEQQGQACCAYHCYREAAKLLPAKSARAAGDRLAQMEQDEQLVARAKVCAELQWCNKRYRQAEFIAEKRPERARRLFSEIVTRSPSDTAIHRAAALKVARLD